jgi:hypothetical protein
VYISVWMGRVYTTKEMNHLISYLNVNSPNCNSNFNRIHIFEWFISWNNFINFKKWKIHKKTSCCSFIHQLPTNKQTINQPIKQRICSSNFERELLICNSQKDEFSRKSYQQFRRSIHLFVCCKPYLKVFLELSNRLNLLHSSILWNKPNVVKNNDEDGIFHCFIVAIFISFLWL